MNNERNVGNLVSIGFVILFLFTATIFTIGYQNGTIDGKNQGLSYCMEQPTKCKVEYDYLKLTKSNQKK